jgi:hypothetical protein
MATSISLQKRKRADSTLDSITVLTLAEEAAICYGCTLHGCHVLPARGTLGYIGLGWFACLPGVRTPVHFSP